MAIKNQVIENKNWTNDLNDPFHCGFDRSGLGDDPADWVEIIDVIYMDGFWIVVIQLASIFMSRLKKKRLPFPEKDSTFTSDPCALKIS